MMTPAEMRGLRQLQEAYALGELRQAARNIVAACRTLTGETNFAPLTERIAREHPEFLRKEKPALYVVPLHHSQQKLY